MKSKNRFSMPPGVQEDRVEGVYRPALLLLGVVTFLWGLAWPVMKIAVSEVPVWTFRTLCVMLGGISVLGLAKARGLSLSIPKEEVKPLILVSSLNVTGWHLLTAYGLLHLDAGRGSVIAHTMPFWAVMISRFVLKERLTTWRLIGLALGMIGLVILIWPDLRAIGKAPFYAVFMLGAAICWAGGTVAMKWCDWTMPIAVLTGWQFIMGGIPIVVGACLFDGFSGLSHLTIKGVLSIAFIILLPMSFCQWAWVKVVKMLPVSVAAIGTLWIPVIGVISSTLVLGEVMTFGQTISLILVVIGLAITCMKG